MYNKYSETGRHCLKVKGDGRKEKKKIQKKDKWKSSFMNGKGKGISKKKIGMG